MIENEYSKSNNKFGTFFIKIQIIKVKWNKPRSNISIQNTEITEDMKSGSYKLKNINNLEVNTSEFI